MKKTNWETRIANSLGIILFVLTPGLAIKTNLSLWAIVPLVIFSWGLIEIKHLDLHLHTKNRRRRRLWQTKR